MKRNMDLVRDLLIEISEDQLQQQYQFDDSTTYHLKLLSDASFVDGLRFLNGPKVIVSTQRAQLSWQGHEFLETIRSKTVWDRIKTLASDKGVDLSIDAIKMLAPKALAFALGQAA